MLVLGLYRARSGAKRQTIPHMPHCAGQEALLLKHMRRTSTDLFETLTKKPS